MKVQRKREKISTLVITRYFDDGIILQTTDGPIRIHVKKGNGSTQIKVCIQSPKNVIISREELLFAQAASTISEGDNDAK